MRWIIPLAAVVALTAAAAGAAAEEPAKSRLEVCQERAKAMRFGIHFIRRDRWIRACLRGKV